MAFLSHRYIERFVAGSALPILNVTFADKWHSFS